MAAQLTGLFPAVEPYDSGWLAVDGGEEIYYEQCGRPTGKPVVVLHGGPGSGCTERMRRFFDPAVYRVILFDQRNCGRSRPHAASLSTSLARNTTPHLLDDIERLRTALGIQRWLVFGGSWGSVLGLRYAETYPNRVSGLLLWGVAVGNSSEIRWMYEDIAPLFPAAWEQFTAGVQGPHTALNLLADYHARLNHPDEAVRARAALRFHEWELRLFSADPNSQMSGRWLDPAFRLARARIITHYFLHNCWLEDGSILAGAGRLSAVPGIMVQGRMDLAAPLASAWSLAKAWPQSELVIVEGAGHSTADSGMDLALVNAAQRLAA